MSNQGSARDRVPNVCPHTVFPRVCKQEIWALFNKLLVSKSENNPWKMFFQLHRWQWYTARTQHCETFLREAWCTTTGLISTDNSYSGDWLIIPNLDMPGIIRVILYNTESPRILKSVQYQSVKTWTGTSTTKHWSLQAFSVYSPH